MQIPLSDGAIYPVLWGGCYLLSSSRRSWLSYIYPAGMKTTRPRATLGDVVVVVGNSIGVHGEGREKGEERESRTRLKALARLATRYPTASSESDRFQLEHSARELFVFDDALTFVYPEIMLHSRDIKRQQTNFISVPYTVYLGKLKDTECIKARDLFVTFSIPYSCKIQNYVVYVPRILRLFYLRVKKLERKHEIRKVRSFPKINIRDINQKLNHQVTPNLCFTLSHWSQRSPTASRNFLTRSITTSTQVGSEP